nr:hypothetical protein [Tanacetum cinerariifolium]
MPPSTPPCHHLPLPPSTPLPGDAPPTTATTKGACGFVKAPRKTPPGCVWSDKQQRAAFGFVINPKRGAFGYRINQTGTFGLAVKQLGFVWVAATTSGCVCLHLVLFSPTGCVGFTATPTRVRLGWLHRLGWLVFVLFSSAVDIYAAVDSCENAREIWLRVQLMMKGSDIRIQEKKAKLFNKWERISSNPRNRQIAQPGMNMGQDRQMQMIGDNGGNQFRQYAGQNAGNLNGYNAVQNVGIQVAQNPRVQNDGIQNQIGNGNLVAVHDEGNAVGHNGNQIRCYNCRGVGHFARDCTVRPRRRDAAYLQTQLLIAQKEEAGIQL